MRNKKFSSNQIFYTLLGVAVVVASTFLLVRAYGPHGPIGPAPVVVLPAQSPYTFSTSSPLVIAEGKHHISGMGTLINYTGTLPAVGSCEEVRTQAPTYGTNPVRFAFIVNTEATSSCANPQAPQTFTTGFGVDASGNTPVLSEVFVNGTKIIYTVNGH